MKKPVPKPAPEQELSQESFDIGPLILTAWLITFFIADTTLVDGSAVSIMSLRNESSLIYLSFGFIFLQTVLMLKTDVLAGTKLKFVATLLNLGFYFGIQESIEKVDTLADSPSAFLAKLSNYAMPFLLLFLLGIQIYRIYAARQRVKHKNNPSKSVKTAKHVTKKPKRTNKQKAVQFVVMSLFIGLGLSERIYNDHIYKPSDPNIIKINNEMDLSEAGTRLFYQSRPKLHDYESLLNTCRLEPKEELINYGCFDQRNEKIHILSIEDGPLLDLMYSFSAHELLHHAYQELSSGDRKIVNTELKKLWDDGVVSESLRSLLLDGYGVQVDEDLYFDELHAFVGTQTKDVGPVLSKHYDRFFNDRAALVAKYTEVSDLLQAQEDEINDYYKQITDMEEELENINTRLLGLKSRLDIGPIALGVGTYNSIVDEYNGGIETYDTIYEEYQKVFATYEQKIDDHNRLFETIIEPREEIEKAESEEV